MPNGTRNTSAWHTSSSFEDPRQPLGLQGTTPRKERHTKTQANESSMEVTKEFFEQILIFQLAIASFALNDMLSKRIAAQLNRLNQRENRL